jgi:hypothetical protein
MAQRQAYSGIGQGALACPAAPGAEGQGRQVEDQDRIRRRKAARFLKAPFAAAST